MFRALLPKPSGFLLTTVRIQNYQNFLGRRVHFASTHYKNLIAEKLSIFIHVNITIQFLFVLAVEVP
jgi:hypothetical protein